MSDIPYNMTEKPKINYWNLKERTHIAYIINDSLYNEKAIFIYDKLAVAVKSACAKILERIIRLEERVAALESENAVMMANLADRNN